jgi:hypothetical protein
MSADDTPPLLDARDRARCAVVARRMEAAHTLGLLALACTAVALIGLAVDAWRDEALTIALGAVLLGLVERYFALRLRLDAGLFADLATGRIASLAALDDGLAAIGVRSGAPRPLDDRIAGCRRLWRRHLAVVLVQAAMTLLAVVSS